jgi:hypothetical protein
MLVSAVKCLYVAGEHIEIIWSQSKDDKIAQFSGIDKSFFYISVFIAVKLNNVPDRLFPVQAESTAGITGRIFNKYLFKLP